MGKVVGLPTRGEVYLVNFDPARGAELNKVRPAVIIQNDTGNTRSNTTIVAGIRSTYKGFRIQVPILKEEGGIDHDSCMEADKLLTVDKSRLIKKLGKLTPETIHKVDEALRISLSLDE